MACSVTCDEGPISYARLILVFCSMSHVAWNPFTSALVHKLIALSGPGALLDISWTYHQGAGLCCSLSRAWLCLHVQSRKHLENSMVTRDSGTAYCRVDTVGFPSQHMKLIFQKLEFASSLMVSVVLYYLCRLYHTVSLLKHKAIATQCRNQIHLHVASVPNPDR